VSAELFHKFIFVKSLLLFSALCTSCCYIDFYDSMSIDDSYCKIRSKSIKSIRKPYSMRREKISNLHDGVNEVGSGALSVYSIC